MEILVAKSSGFCFGVKRAITMAEKCSAQARGEAIYTLGPIIHNPQVVKGLEEKRVFAKKGLDEIEAGTVIIRSHGIRLSEYEEAGAKGLKVIDATCPFVKKTQDYVRELSRDGYNVIVVGEKDHPEVKGVVSYGNAAVRVVISAEELKDMPRVKKIGIVAQTTQALENLEAVVSFCLDKANEIKVYNTICNATSTRQKESVELAKKVDMMIVAGGKNSANTKRLASICRSIQPNTHHIETADEMEPAWVLGVEKAGVTAGASTPRWIIEEVVERLKGLAVGALKSGV